MSQILDLHVHTRRYSTCSKIRPEQLIHFAVQAGLDGLVITEHHAQWEEGELAELIHQSGHPGFLLLAGFEYTSSQGDVLVYGLSASQAKAMPPGAPVDVFVDKVHELGGVCIAAHPTRACMGFDEGIADLTLEGVEVCSVNLRGDERRLAMALAKGISVPAIASSDAHRIGDVGCFATAFEKPIQHIDSLCDALRSGRFRPAATAFGMAPLRGVQAR